MLFHPILPLCTKLVHVRPKHSPPFIDSSSISEILLADLFFAGVVEKGFHGEVGVLFSASPCRTFPRPISHVDALPSPQTHKQNNHQNQNAGGCLPNF